MTVVGDVVVGEGEDEKLSPGRKKAVEVVMSHGKEKKRREALSLLLLEGIMSEGPARLLIWKNSIRSQV